MKQPTEHNIPVLTEILKHGDANMNRHFDTQGFDYPQQPVGISAEKVEELVTELLEEMLPKFKQQLLARLQKKLKA
jgi:hypothetical protein